MKKRSIIYSFTFFLDKKNNKKVKRVRWVTFPQGKFSSYELAGERVIYWKGSNSVTLLRVLRGVMEAQNFSLNVSRHLVLLLVKNEALEQFLQFEKVAFDLSSDLIGFNFSAACSANRH